MEVRKFILHIVAYFAVFFLFCILVVFAVGWLMGRASFELPAEVNTVVLGDSHVECAINDTILDQTVNLSMAGEAYLYSYLKAKTILKANPQVDTLWLAYDFNSLEEWKDTLTRSERYNKYKLPFHFFMLDAEDLHLFVDQFSFYSVLARTPYMRRRFIKLALRSSTTYQDLKIGGYQYLVRDRLKADVAKKDSAYLEHAVRTPHFGKAMDQVEYLDKIVALCKERNVTCILLNTPTHSVVARDADTSAYYAYWCNHLQGTTLWDHSAWELPDSCFGDATHLNHWGAERYSERLKELRSLGWPTIDREGRTAADRTKNENTLPVDITANEGRIP
ncbi:MAG: hypothetical protein IPO87_00920 [Flavobacteriales bacterium]|nr:hypothetical protein [Flavobacteriales bacterium]